MGLKNVLPFLEKPFLSLDIGSSSVKLALLKKGPRGFELVNFGMIPLPADAIVDGEVESPEAVSEAIMNLLKAEKIPKGIKQCVFSVSGQSVIIKKITVPLMSEDDLADSIQQEAEQYIPFDIDEVNVDFQIVKAEGAIPKKGEKAGADDDRQMDVLLVAAKKEIIAQQSEIIAAAGLKPTIVDLDVFALENGFEIAYGIDPDDTVALVNIGASATNINIIETGITAYTRDVQVGGNTITEAIQKNMNVGFRDADRYKLGHLDEGVKPSDVATYIKKGVATLCEELTKTFDLYSRTSESRVRRIYLAGGTAQMDGIDHLVGAELGLTCEVINPFRSIKYNPKVFDGEYLQKVAPSAVIALGLASRRLDDK
ncbi:MAG: type IV pilus assembly protein PilM [Nitrospinae bacterium]|nr:type IV pilus assembly protein PilM [Nitrospinota bacterium]